MPSGSFPYHRAKTCMEKIQLAGSKKKTERNSYQTLVLKAVIWIHLVVYYDLNSQESREP